MGRGDRSDLSAADHVEPQRPIAHECLGEALRILRQVINKYPLLNTLETLTAAGTLISRIKGELAARTRARGSQYLTSSAGPC